MQVKVICHLDYFKILFHLLPASNVQSPHNRDLFKTKWDSFISLHKAPHWLPHLTQSVCQARKWSIKLHGILSPHVQFSDFTFNFFFYYYLFSSVIFASFWAWKTPCHLLSRLLYLLFPLQEALSCHYRCSLAYFSQLISSSVTLSYRLPDNHHKIFWHKQNSSVNRHHITT